MANQLSTINYFAQTDFRGKKISFGIKSEDRGRHMYIIGKTGMGKSVLLENIAIQDIKNGEGIGFIDPHGKSADLLLEYVPEERIKDVVYFAPFDLDYPISFNVMEDVGKDQRHLVANGLMATFKKIWPDVWSARMEYILGNTILALLEYPESTLLGVNRMLSEKAFREKVVANVSDPSVKAFWVDEFAKYNERYMQEAGDAIKNKIGQFTSNPLIRNIIGQPKSSFDIRKIMDDKKILIMNLSKGRVGEQNANLLGGMLITKIYLAAMSRAAETDATLRTLPPFYLFVDEFQSFVNDSFADILAEARKYKLCLTIAHQYIEQMPETVRNAVFGNVGTTIAFRVGPLDAELLEKIFTPTFTQEDLVGLGFAQIYLTLMIDGIGSPPFSATTLPPIVSLADSFKDQIIENSRRVYAAPREKVETEIVSWHQDTKKDESLGKASLKADWPKKERFEDRPKGNRQPDNRPKNQPPVDRALNRQEIKKRDDSYKPEPVNHTLKTNVNQSQNGQRIIPQSTISLSALKNNKDKSSGHNRESLRSALKDILATVKNNEEDIQLKPKESEPVKENFLTKEQKNLADDVLPSLSPKISLDKKSEVPEEVLRKMLSDEDDS